MWAEMDGTFTNFEHRLQRFKRAFEAPGEAKPRFEVALDLLARLGQPMGAATAGDVFVEMAVSAPGLAGLTHRSVGPKGVAPSAPASA
jgi:predicted molibdopterin-dependent oxidoreductase YjgC